MHQSETQRPPSRRPEAFGPPPCGRALHLRALHARLKSTGGFTVDPASGEPVTSGLAVCAHQLLSKRVRWDTWNGPVTAGWLRALLPRLRATNRFLGGWLDHDGCTAWLEGVLVLPGTQRREALHLAVAADQRAIYDLDHARPIPVPSLLQHESRP